MSIETKVDSNAVEGFSSRFNELLDHSGVPKKNRVSYGAKRFDVAHNTFKGWCTGDKTPKTYKVLLAIVSDLLEGVSGIHNDHAVTAWLLAGDAVQSPFTENVKTLELIEIFLEVVALAKKKSIEFDSLTREARELILERARDAVASDVDAVIEREGHIKFSKSTTVMVGSLLDMANTLVKK